MLSTRRANRAATTEQASLAQSAERLHGKEKVWSSILQGGSPVRGPIRKYFESGLTGSRTGSEAAKAGEPPCGLWLTKVSAPMLVNDDASRRQGLCGKWMPITQDYCGRGAGHPKGACRSAKAMESQRARARAADRPYDPIAAQRWRSVHRLTRYGLTPEAFDQMLADQEYACGMCLEPFQDGHRIHIDHDHTMGCHPGEKQACARCRRGLLCLGCNLALGIIESKYAQARGYLDTWRLARRTKQKARPPQEPGSGALVTATASKWLTPPVPF